MDLSLDEIIKRKKIGVKPVKKNFPVKRTVARPTTTVRQGRVLDARNKIIQKKRSKIRDAREKLTQIAKSNGDARLKLIRKKKTVPQPPVSNNTFRSKKTIPIKQKTHFNPKILPIAVPRGYIDYDNMEVEEEYDPISINLRRTVHNDMAPPFGYSLSDRPAPSVPQMWPTDPFDCYEIPISRRPDMGEPGPRRETRTMSPDIMPRKGILRASRQVSPSSYSRRFVPDDHSHLSYEMRSRLERAPDPHQSVGIFANPNKKQSSISLGSSNSPAGYRIVVSNLHTSVTQSDIKELFEDIGQLLEARLVRPGVAEVIFKSLKDAEKAVDTYHNRQLDGQPMKCLLVHPRASNKPTAPALTANNSLSTRSSNKTPLEIDIDALHKVLFRRH